MKKCNYCNGNGSRMKGIIYIVKGGRLQPMNKKQTCTKCHGKGYK
jgi:hypothetical protein